MFKAIEVISSNIFQFIFDQLLVDDGPVSPSETISYPSWSVGIPNALYSFEMALLAIMHVWAYPFDVYKPSVVAKLDTRASHPSEVHIVDMECYGSSGTGDGVNTGTEISQGGLFGWRAIVDALNLMDMVEAIALMIRYLIGRSS